MERKKESIIIERNINSKFLPILDQIKERVKHVVRGIERGIVNPFSKSSILLKENGDINIVSSTASQVKIRRDGKITEVSCESETITNKKKITADDLIINGHKLNPKLFEFTDMRSVLGHEDKMVSNFTTGGTVLVKAWDSSLGKYVLIRRQARIPIFSPKLNAPTILPGLDIDDDLLAEFEKMRESTRDDRE